MKRTTLFVAILLSTAFYSFGQSATPYVTLKGLTKPDVAGTPKLTTSERIAREGQLQADVPGATVTGFTLTINAGDKTYGPFTAKGAALTSQMIDNIKQTRSIGVLVHLDNIHVNYEGRDIVASPVTLRYDQ